MISSKKFALVATVLGLLLALTPPAGAETPPLEPSGAVGGGRDARADASGYAYGHQRVDRFTPLGSLSLPGFNADVWENAGFAYVGTWGTAAGYPARCPATGVRIIDLADPLHPALVGA